MKKFLLPKLPCKKILFCAALLVTTSVALYAQEDGAAKNQNLDKFVARRTVAQARVDKTEAERKTADSLIAEGERLTKEGNAEMKQLLDDQIKLEKRVFGVELPAVDKQIKSKDAQERKTGMEKRSEIRKTYNADIKALQVRSGSIQKKLKDAKKNEVRGRDKLKLADKAWKDAVAALKAIEKEIAALEDAEKNKEREALQAQKKKEDAETAKQKQKEENELKKQKQKEDALAKREAEKAKLSQEREKKKNKETEKREKEKASVQREKEKTAAKREADKATSEQKSAKAAKSAGDK
ncbi:MAG: hypothetical protein LBK18_06800 [Prevotellaceae bacterium]|jgi:colicin import membrane protein|nr:hypothetical protein [Prevotellaceae bacterium]